MNNPDTTRTLTVTTKYIFNINPKCEASNMRTSTIFPDPVTYALQDDAFFLNLYIIPPGLTIFMYGILYIVYKMFGI